MLKAVLIDDEEDAIYALKKTIDQIDFELNIVATAMSVQNGIEAILTHQPDLVLLDIQMPGSSGFDVLSNIKERNFQTIFISAHINHAIEAVKFHAMGYLLKPVDPQLLLNTLEETKKYILENHKPAYNELLDTNQLINKRMAIPTLSGYLYLDFDQIIQIAANRNYSEVLTAKSHKPIVVSRNLKQFEVLLSSKGFLRISHSIVVNTKHIMEFSRSDGGWIKLTNNQIHDIGKAYREQTEKILHNNASYL